MRLFIPALTLSTLLFATACGTTPAGMSTAARAGSAGTGTTVEAKGFDYPKEIRDRIERGELAQLYGSFFRGVVRSKKDHGRAATMRLTSTFDSETPGEVLATVTSSHVHQDMSHVKVGDVVDVFVNYTLVDRKGGRIADIGRPYHAMLWERRR